MKYTLLLCLFVASCSSKKMNVVDPEDYLKIHVVNKNQHKACIQHRDNVLVKAITESETPDLDDEQYYFVRNEKTALQFINSFDITKFTLKENQQEYQAIVDGCVVERNPLHQTCDTIMPAFKYFRGLIHGMNQYQWSPDTIRKGTHITLSYLKYVGESDSSIMDVLFANNLLTRLSQRSHISKEIAPQSTALRRKAEKTYRELMAQLKKIGKRELTCTEAREFYAKERVKVKELSGEFLEILAQAMK